MNSYNLSMTIGDIKLETEKVLAVLNAITDKYAYNTNTEPDVKHIRGDLVADKSCGSTFDWVQNYQNICTFIRIAEDYVHSIMKLAESGQT